MTTRKYELLKQIVLTDSSNKVATLEEFEYPIYFTLNLIPIQNFGCKKPASFFAKVPSLNKLISYEIFTNGLDIWSEDS